MSDAPDSRSMTDARKALLQRWLRGEARPAAAIPPRPADAPIPLSATQERYWYLESLRPGTAVNHLSLCLLLEGPLDAGRMAEAVAALGRHEAPRTRFVRRGAGAEVIIDDTSTLQADIEDLSALPEQSRDADALRRAEAALRRPFDLAKAPLWRVRLYRLGQERHVLLVVMHHLVGDGWTFGLFFREVLARYGGATDAVLPAPAVRYSDFAAWQRAQPASSYEADLSWWRTQLPLPTPTLDLPHDRPRRGSPRFRGAAVPLDLGVEGTAALRELARRLDVSLYMVLMTALQAVLYRYTGESDLRIDTAVSGRTLPDLEPILGAFQNTMVLRATPEAATPFSELVASVKASTLAGLAHPGVPYQALVEELKPPRANPASPLCQVAFILQNSPAPPMASLGLRPTVIPLYRGATPVDLIVDMVEADGRLVGRLEVDADLFELDTARGLAAAYTAALLDAAANPDRPIGELNLLDEAGRQALARWSGPVGEVEPTRETALDRFRAMATAHPERIAARGPDGELTYGAMAARARRLGRRLLEAGVAPDARVGICAEPSIHLPVAIFGVMEAGRAWVPLDPLLPVAQLRLRLEDAGAQVVLCEAALEERLRAAGAQPLRLDLDPDPVEPEGPLPGVRPEDLAYLIYTSGSTGTPKGVLIRHHSLWNALQGYTDALGLGPDDVFFGITPLSFDPSTLEAILPLCIGARIQAAPRGIGADGPRLMGALDAAGACIFQATPSKYRLLLEAGWVGNPGLKLLCGGELLTRKLADTLLERCGALWNLYGPTETTVWATIAPVRADGAAISAGKPVRNYYVAVLDERLRPLPFGALGELAVGGEGVGLGYWRQPERSAERFYEADTPGPWRRWYRSGDRARMRADGTVDIVGRIDRQVKIRGMRVEPGEVEARLDSHPEVRQCVVLAASDGAEGLRLLAYVVPRGAPPRPSELREHLGRLLPPWMIPSLFLFLDQLPLSRHGKVDLSALPPPPPGREVLQTELAPPRDALEASLARLYAEALDIREVGVHDSFLDLGGASVQVMDLVARAQAQGLGLTPAIVLEHQTVAAVARAITSGEET